MASTLAHLREWMPRQRWYAGKGAEPALDLVAEWDLGSDGGARAQILLVADAARTETVLYQVPVVWHTGTAPGPMIARVGDETLTDGAADPVFQSLLYGLLTAGGTVAGADGPLTATPAGGGAAPPAPARVLGGEQSNTSIIFEPPGDRPVIAKVFRQVHPGTNPDIELQAALADAGIRSVPPLVGSLAGAWREPRAGGLIVTGSLAFAQQFFPGVEDAWRVALRAAADDVDFSAPARELGRAVADVHVALARLFPTRELTSDDRARTAAGWRGRRDAALEAVPELRALEPRIEAVFARALEGPWPRLQRVHGDLHLGQVLEVPSRGWVLLDFEGEPMRPIAERHAPDLAVRDVAGMLRSFAYAADSAPHALRERESEWAQDASRAFLSGYEAASGDASPDPALLLAFLLDKALYETVYEARNRPDWLPIPLGAVRRIADV